MGIFQDMKAVRNLAPVALNVRFDGQEMSIEPGVTNIPSVSVPYAMNQNPIMGSADADNPNISGARYLIVPVNSKYDREPLTKEEWEAHLNRPCRIDEEAFFGDRLGRGEHVIIRGKGRNTQAKSSFDAGVRVASGSVYAGDRD
jgi:hypothetical protein